jgi:dynein heavy chain
MQDVNNLLNIGEVQGLINQEDMEKITDVFKAPLLARGVQPTKQNLLGLLTDRTKANLHVVFCMSPSSKLFRFAFIKQIF